MPLLENKKKHIQVPVVYNSNQKFKLKIKFLYFYVKFLYTTSPMTLLAVHSEKETPVAHKHDA